MSKTTLIVVIGAAALVVGTIGAVTATVIVRNEDDGVRMVVAPAPAPPGQDLPGRRGGRGGPGVGPLRGQRDCLRQHGLGGEPGTRDALPDLKTMRDALEACRGALPPRLRLPKP